MSLDTFKCRRTLTAGGKEYDYYSLPEASKAGIGDLTRLPISLKILLENLLRFEDNNSVKIEDIKALGDAVANPPGAEEISYRPARVLMQDFTGVPGVADLAAMRSAVVAAGHDPSIINPLSPVDLVIDHSVMVDKFGNDDAFQQNVAIEMERNAERYRFRGYGGYRNRGRVRAGDIIAGVAILGGIAAVASAASRNRDRDRYRDRRYRTSAPRYDTSSGLDRAVDQCVREIERDVRIGDINGVDRTGSGWNVTGTLYNGDGFTCRIGQNGRIEGVDYGGQRGFSGAAYSGQSGVAPTQGTQWNDDAYARARSTSGYGQADVPSATASAGVPTATQGAQPAYPGGPVAGEPQYSDEDGYGG